MNLSQTSTTRPEITTKDFGALKLKFSDAKTGCDDVTYQDKLDQTNDIEDFKLHQIQLKTKEFNEKLRKNPRDEKLWLEFVDFQDQVRNHSCYSTVTCKVLLNRPQHKLGQSCTNSWHKIEWHANRRRALVSAYGAKEPGYQR